MSINSRNAGGKPALRRLARGTRGPSPHASFMLRIVILVLCGAVCCAPGDEQPAPLAIEMPSEPRTGEAMIVILGASYAKGWQPREIPGVQFVNRGVGGQQSFEVLDRFHEDVVLLNPRAVILWGYINDLFRSRPDQRAAAKARARESFLEMIRLARENGIEPIAATEVTIRAKAGSAWPLGCHAARFHAPTSRPCWPTSSRPRRQSAASLT